MCEANFRDLSPLISAMSYSGPVDAHGSAAKGRRGRVRRYPKPVRSIRHALNSRSVVGCQPMMRSVVL